MTSKCTLNGILVDQCIREVQLHKDNVRSRDQMMRLQTWWIRRIHPSSSQTSQKLKQTWTISAAHRRPVGEDHLRESRYVRSIKHAQIRRIILLIEAHVRTQAQVTGGSVGVIGLG